MLFNRFNDIHVPVRLECVKFASHCLMNHPDLAKDLTGEVCSYKNATLDGDLLPVSTFEAKTKLSWLD